MTNTVTLTFAELMIAGYVALMRRVLVIKQRRPGRFGESSGDGSWERHIIGCQTEMAVAKHFNLYWAGSIHDFKAVDVGGLIEVRACTSEHHKLIIHPDDKDDYPYVLVYAEPPDYRLIGWMLGRDAKQQQFWADPAGGRPAYFVPQTALNPIETLRMGRHGGHANDNHDHRSVGRDQDAQQADREETSIRPDLPLAA